MQQKQWEVGMKIRIALVGDIGILSFNGNKLITTGGGGALLTNNELPEELDTCQQHKKYRTLGI